MATAPKYTIPEVVKLNTRKLENIDTIAAWAIREKAFPGCQILVAKDGMICYEKSFGTFTYENDTQNIKNDDAEQRSVPAGAAPSQGRAGL